MTTGGRGAWTKAGFPANGSGIYQLLSPINVGSQPLLGQSYRAVAYGVKALQMRINELGYTPALVTDGWFGPKTGEGAIWVQHHVGVVVDGQIGPKTATAMFWPSIQHIAGEAIAHTVGGITAHESGYDPGAVGSLDSDDLGLVQINGPANPTLSENARFDYHVAFNYCNNRITSALATYHNLDYAIASYANPSWAQTWAQTGKPPNDAVVAYVNFVKAWVPPS